MTAAHGHEIITHSSDLLRWIPLLPLIGSAINFLVGSRIQKNFGRGGVAGLAIAMPALSFVLVVMSFLQLAGYPADERLITDHVLKWIHIGTLNADIAFQFDPLTAVMCLVVTGIGSLIHVYSYGYMDDEPAAWRYFALLNLFMFAMLCLVMGDNSTHNVPRLGGCGTVFLGPDRLLVQRDGQRAGRQQSLHRQPRG